MFLRNFLSQKGLANAKVLLFNSSKLLNFQKPIGSFLKPNIITSFLISDLVISTIKSLSILIYYIWEWVLMILGIIITLISIYLYFSPSTFLLSYLPLEILGIEQPLPWYKQLIDYPLTKINDTYNYLSSIYLINEIFHYLNVGFNLIYNTLDYIFNALSSITLIFGNLLKLFSYLSLATIVSGILWITIQFWFYTEQIVQLAISFVAATPNLPNVLALGASFFYLRLLDPIMNIIDNGGSGLDVLINLLPSESQIMSFSADLTRIINNHYQLAWSTAACAFIEFFSIPVSIGGFSLDITGFYAQCIIKILNPLFGVGIPSVLDRIIRIFSSWELIF